MVSQTLHTVFKFTVPVVVISAYVLHILLYRGAVNYTVHLAMVGIILLFYNLYDVRELIEQTNTQSDMARKKFAENTLKDIYFHDETNLLPLQSRYTDRGDTYKYTFTYLHMQDDLLDIAKDLAFVKAFDKAAYDKFLVLMDRFLNAYYDILSRCDCKTGTDRMTEYDCIDSFETMLMLRTELLNTMHSMVINVPIQARSNKLRAKLPLDRYIERRIEMIQAYTYKKLRIISRKCNKNNRYIMRFKAPWPHNRFTSDVHYGLWGSH